MGITFFASLFLATALAHSPAPSTVNVSGRVIADCSISTDYSVSFSSPYDPFNQFKSYGTYDESASPSHVELHCTKTAQALIYIDHGLYGTQALAPAYGLRAMKQGSAPGKSPISYLTYHLCQDTACAKEWGTASDAASGSAFGYVYASQSKREADLAVYGRINGGQNVGTGSYSDTVTVSIQF